MKMGMEEETNKLLAQSFNCQVPNFESRNPTSSERIRLAHVELLYQH